MHLTHRTPLGTAALAAALGIAAGLLAGCGGEQVAERPPVVRPVKTIVVGGETSISLSYPGRVQSADRVELSFRVRGPVIELPVKEGQKIDEGALIARIDPRDYQLAVDEANASFQKAESDLERYQRLYEQDAVPLSDLELHQAQRDVAHARVEQAEANLDYTRLRAPFTGEIGRRYIEKGENVEAGQPIVSLHGTDQIEVVIDVPEAYRAYLASGALKPKKLTASFDFAPGREFPLTVKEVASRADDRTRTYRATFSMVQPEGLEIRPGMTANFSYIATIRDGADQFIIPATAVQTDDSGEQYVWVVDETDFTVHRQPVIAGEITGTSGIVIQSGLDGGERIAVSAASRLREGMGVRLWQGNEETEP